MKLVVAAELLVVVTKLTASHTLIVSMTARAVRPVTKNCLTWVPRDVAIVPLYPRGQLLNPTKSGVFMVRVRAAFPGWISGDEQPE